MAEATVEVLAKAVIGLANEVIAQTPPGHIVKRWVEEAQKSAEAALAQQPPAGGDERKALADLGEWARNEIAMLRESRDAAVADASRLKEQLAKPCPHCGSHR